MATFDENTAEKKLRNLSTTQDSIQGLSLWAIQHKAHHEKFVDTWLKTLKKAKIEQRLVLFYLCNDIIQTCKRKHAIVYKDAFKEVLKDATLLVRDQKVRPNIERMFNIWKERGVYDADFTDEISSILNNTKVRSAINSRLLQDFKPQKLVDKIMLVKRIEDEVELKRRQVVNLRLDASSVEAVKQLKDRSHGRAFCQDFETACQKMEDFVAKMEKDIKERTAQIEILEQSEIYYDAQYGEAKIVTNAYKNFGTRINNLRKRLEEHKSTLAGGSSPVPSPVDDAPSPENTPPQPTEPAVFEPPSPPSYDPRPTGYDANVEAIDMDMSDEESAANSENSKKYSISDPAPEPSFTPPGTPPPLAEDAPSPEPVTMQMSPFNDDGGDVNDSYQYNPDQSYNLDTSYDPGHQIPTLGEASAAPGSQDEGGGTPVMDEVEEGEERAAEPIVPVAQSVKANPIDFLTQLLNTTKNTSSGDAGENTEGATPGFLQNLALLSNTGKQNSYNEYDPHVDTQQHLVDTPQQEVEADAEEAGPTWEAWQPGDQGDSGFGNASFQNNSLVDADYGGVQTSEGGEFNTQDYSSGDYNPAQVDYSQPPPLPVGGDDFTQPPPPINTEAEFNEQPQEYNTEASFIGQQPPGGTTYDPQQNLYQGSQFNQPYAPAPQQPETYPPPPSSEAYPPPPISSGVDTFPHSSFAAVPPPPAAPIMTPPVGVPPPNIHSTSLQFNTPPPPPPNFSTPPPQPFNNPPPEPPFGSLAPPPPPPFPLQSEHQPPSPNKGPPMWNRPPPDFSNPPPPFASPQGGNPAPPMNMDQPPPPLLGMNQGPRFNNGNNARRNLTQIQTDNANESFESSPNSEGSIPTISGSNRINGPPRHPFLRPPGPPPHLLHNNSPFNDGHNNDQQEFIDKLKRKSSFPMSGPPGGGSSNRNLTAIPTADDGQSPNNDNHRLERQDSNDSLEGESDSGGPGMNMEDDEIENMENLRGGPGGGGPRPPLMRPPRMPFMERGSRRPFMRPGMRFRPPGGGGDFRPPPFMPRDSPRGERFRMPMKRPPPLFMGRGPPGRFPRPRF